MMRKGIKAVCSSIFMLMLMVGGICNISLASSDGSIVSNNFSQAIEKSTVSIAPHLDAGPTGVNMTQ